MSDRENKVLHKTTDPGMYMIWCEGCKCCHGIWTDPANPNQITGSKWSFDGNMESPTFAPSLLVTHEWHDHSTITEDEWGPWTDHPTMDGTRSREVKPEFKHKVITTKEICHSFIRNGHIEYLHDCTHALAGQTLPLKPF